MKKILLFLMAVLITAITFKTSAQCTGGSNNCALAISNAVIEIVDTTCNYGGDANKTKIIFNAAFDLTYNNGNKLIYFHSWLETNYPNYFPCSGGAITAPKNSNGAKLGTAVDDPGMSFLDIGLDNSVARGNVGVVVDVPILESYAPDGSVVMITGFTATKTHISGNTDRFELTGIEVILNLPCTTPAIVKTDVWSTNGTQATTAQCFIAGLGQSINDPAIALRPLCGNPRQFEFSIQTAVAAPTEFFYEVYAHDPIPAGGGYTPYADVLVHSGSVILSSGTPSYNSDPVTITEPGFCCFSPWSEADLRLEVSAPSLFTNAITTPNINIGCATLPVNLKSFTATRTNRSTVNLKWETAQEENSKGFEVERKLSNGSWQTIEFVRTKAVNGNSSLPLIYELTDLNDSKGITQYRLRQLDIDGKQALSQIRAVRGEGQKGKTIIYPNPSGDGKVNIVFESGNSTRDVSLMDVSGKTLKQWKGVTNNNIQIDNLNAGFYTVRIVNTETGEQVVEKFIVNKR